MLKKQKSYKIQLYQAYTYIVHTIQLYQAYTYIIHTIQQLKKKGARMKLGTIDQHFPH